MSSAPLWFRKLPIREDGEFALLPLYVRGLAAMILKFCDDQGRLVLGGRSAADVIARRCGAEPNERRSIARDIEQLIKVGYLRISNDALVVIDQTIEWEKIGSSRASGSRPNGSRRASSMHPASVRDASDVHPTCTPSDSSTRNHSGRIRQQEETRSEKKRSEEQDQISPNGECEGAETSPKTDPTPSLLTQNFDKLVGKGPAAWGMEGSGPAPEDLIHPAKNLEPNHPTQDAARPSPPAAHGARDAASDGQTPIQVQIPPAKGHAGATATLVDLGAPTKVKTTTAKKSPAKKPATKAAAATKVETPQPIPLPADWAPNEGHYEYGLMKFGYKKRHVDHFADEMRDHAAQHQRKQLDWDASFRTWMRKAWEFNGGKLPNVPEPVVQEPKRPMPPPPPRHPAVIEGAKRAQEILDRGGVINVRDLFKRVGHRFEDEAEATQVEP